MKVLANIGLFLLGLVLYTFMDPKGRQIGYIVAGFGLLLVIAKVFDKACNSF